MQSGGAGHWTFPFGEAPGRGSWPRCRQHSLGWKPAPGGPALVQRPHRFLFGARNLRRGGCGDRTGHGHLERCQAGPAGARGKGTLVSLRSTPDPSSAAVRQKPSDLPSLSLTLTLTLTRGVRGPQGGARLVLSPGQLL